jgi:hypothetical protein
VYKLADDNKLTESVRRRMKACITREQYTNRRRLHGEIPAYLWPLTPSGFKRRAAWARMQAKLAVGRRGDALRAARSKAWAAGRRVGRRGAAR